MTAYHILLYAQLILAPIVLISLLFITAPYGRHHQGGWGLNLDSRRAWILMEFPAVATLLIVCLFHAKNLHPVNCVFVLLWEIHYLYRTFYFPFQLRQSKKNFPLAIVGFAIVFNLMNGYINGYELFVRAPLTDMSIFARPAFWGGLALFAIGFVMHIRADRTIIALRKNTDVRYAIPKGGMFRFVTNPNYLGEFVQWTGWALLTWSMAGAAFAIFTFCNLFPRAVSNHRWYRNTFPNYPTDRKPFFPFLF